MYKSIQPVFTPNNGVHGEVLANGESKYLANIQQLDKDTLQFPLRSEAKELGIRSMLYIKVPGGIYELASETEKTKEEVEIITKDLK